MDMQNVKNLTIPEGDVKTIHDKDSRLLWGAVGYDTKYAGDTFQQTYSGKNLLQLKQRDTPSRGITATINSDGSITVSGTASATYADIAASSYPSYSFPIGTSLTFSIGEALPVAVRAYFGGWTQINAGQTQGTSMTTVNTSSIYMSLLGLTVGTTYNFTIKKPMLEQGSTATTYEPYVGGTASPNPDYPQDVQVVTGEQTVSITDGTNTQNFTVDLGSTKLAKIGNYQNYIYKSGDDWYVHKAIENITLDGTQSIAIPNWRASATSVGWVYAYNEFNSATIAAGSVGAIVSDKLLAASFTSLFDKAQDYGVALYTNTDYGLAVRVKDTSLTTSAAINAYLGSNPMTVYYPLVTPTDTKITDNTLTTQLNAIHQWLTRYGYQASVTGNLPMIIRQDALT